MTPRALLARLFPGRFRLAGIVLAASLLLGSLTRIGLAIFNDDAAMLPPGLLVRVLAIGAAYDLTAGIFVVLPFALLAWLWP
ncbi:MAG: hypothetical protein ACREBN_03525, partial [Burkholderiaceae bacterium]